MYATQRDTSLVEELVHAVGREAVVTDADELRYLSMDLMWSDAVATASVRPRDVEQISRLVRIASRHGAPIVARGGGMSYTRGYVPRSDSTLMLDMRAMDNIVELNADDMYITAQAGCTWKTIYDALRAEGLRMPYFGPVSGMHATVGGTLSQGSMFFGSGTYGPVAESTLSMKVVLGDGRIICTGSRANRGGIPFNRYFGPDLTGLFLSDTGALGVKAEASFRLIKAPAATRYGSYEFDSFEDLYFAQSQIARHRVVAECFALDPFLGGKRTNLKSWTEGAKTLAKMARSAGIGEALKSAKAGADLIDDECYSMHLTVDGFDDDDADRKLRLIESIALAKGRAIEATIPKALRAEPFRHVGDYLLGEEGRRWIPIHANLPLSKVPQAHRLTSEYFVAHLDEMEAHGISTGFSTSIAGTDMIFEPQFFWPDELTEFHIRHVSPSALKSYKDNGPGPAARAVVERMMHDLTDIYRELGAVHQQIGKFYNYGDAIDADTFALLREIKRAVDPQDIVNPGALGLSR